MPRAYYISVVGEIFFGLLIVYLVLFGLPSIELLSGLTLVKG